LLGALESGGPLLLVGDIESTLVVEAEDPSIVQVWFVRILLTFLYMLIDVSCPSVQRMPMNHWF